VMDLLGKPILQAAYVVRYRRLGNLEGVVSHHLTL
jgi:hypothetical protein